MRNRIIRVAAVGLFLAGVAVSSATAKHATVKTSHLVVGINDEAYTLYGNPAAAFETLRSLRVQVLRVNLYWGGTKWAVANSKPADPTNPGDPAYKWALYDRIARYAHDSGIQLMFTILFTPSWANGGAARTRPPTSFTELRDFAYAAGVRYSGYYTPPAAQQDPTLGGGPLPAVTMWTAWNEPNNPIWLTPQYVRVGKSWRIQSAYNYAQICNAVYSGIHSVLISPERGAVPDEQVACGVTGPKGNDAPRTSRPSVDPLSFLTAAHKFGMKTFDVYAHHPYAAAGNEPPAYVPRGTDNRRIQLGNINVLINAVSRLYGPKNLWITEYGYETNPPDRTTVATSWQKQAQYMRQAYAIARANPHIAMMLWFLIHDQPQLSGWQSGLATANGAQKPAWNVFKNLPRG
jgi:Glycosyl hydrolase catalytic core